MVLAISAEDNESLPSEQLLEKIGSTSEATLRVVFTHKGPVRCAIKQTVCSASIKRWTGTHMWSRYDCESRRMQSHTLQ